MKSYAIQSERLKRYWKKIKVTKTCWNWIGYTTDSGYGAFSVGYKMYPAHRFLWERFNGEMPKDLVLDHICRNKACVNPLHLRAVTNRENILFGTSPAAKNARKTHCLRGHELTPENITIYRHRPTNRNCKICIQLRPKLRRERRKKK